MCIFYLILIGGVQLSSVLFALFFFLSCVLIGAVPVYFFWSGSEAVFRTSSFMVSARFY